MFINIHRQRKFSNTETKNKNKELYPVTKWSISSKQSWLSVRKSDIIYHSNRLKKQNHMIISIKAEKAFPLFIRPLNKQINIINSRLFWSTGSRCTDRQTITDIFWSPRITSHECPWEFPSSSVSGDMIFPFPATHLYGEIFLLIL